MSTRTSILTGVAVISGAALTATGLANLGPATAGAICMAVGAAGVISALALASAAASEPAPIAVRVESRRRR